MMLETAANCKIWALLARGGLKGSKTSNSQQPPLITQLHPTKLSVDKRNTSGTVVVLQSIIMAELLRLRVPCLGKLGCHQNIQKRKHPYHLMDPPQHVQINRPSGRNCKQVYSKSRILQAAAFQSPHAFSSNTGLRKEGA